MRRCDESRQWLNSVRSLSFDDAASGLTVIAVLDFLDYYFQLLGYIGSRKERRAKFDEDTGTRNLSQAEYNKEFKSYCGRERVLLRRRRAKLRVDQFHIIAQVGQGGYGEVFLARKKETGEVCALKKMRKRTLFKMDEVRVIQTTHTNFDSILRRSAMFLSNVTS